MFHGILSGTFLFRDSCTYSVCIAAGLRHNKILKVMRIVPKYAEESSNVDAMSSSLYFLAPGKALSLIETIYSLI